MKKFYAMKLELDKWLKNYLDLLSFLPFIVFNAKMTNCF